jgi:hypothetical protein
MHFKKMMTQASRSKGRMGTEKLILKLRRLKGERAGPDRLLFIYRGDITEFTGDAIVNAGTWFSPRTPLCVGFDLFRKVCPAWALLVAGLAGLRKCTLKTGYQT